jgi:hypothetical protein
MNAKFLPSGSENHLALAGISEYTEIKYLFAVIKIVESSTGDWII